MDDLAEELTSYGEQSNLSTVVRVTQVTLFGPFDNESGLPRSRNCFALPYLSEGVMFQFLQP